MTSRDEIKDIRKAQLKEAAIQLFGTKGFAATTISEITSSAQLSHGLFYHYFKSKEDIYIAVIHEVLDLINALTEEAAQLPYNAYSQLKWLTEQTHSGSVREGVYRHILILQALYADELKEDAKHEIVEKYNCSMKKIVKIIERGQEEGDITEGDSEELAIYYLSLGQGLLLWNARQLKPIKVSADKVLRQLRSNKKDGATS